MGASEKQKGLWRRLLRQARPYWGSITFVFILYSLATPLALLAPLPLKIVVDNVLGEQPLPVFISMFIPEALQMSTVFQIGLAIGLLLSVAVLLQAQILASTYLGTATGERLVLSLRARLFHYMQRLSIAYHDMRGTTDSTYRIQYDAMAIRFITIDGVLPLISAFLTVVGMICVTAYLDPQLALVALMICPILLITTIFFRRKLRDQWREVKKLESQAMSVVQESLSAARVVKAFGQEEWEHDRFMHHSGNSMLANLRVYLAEGGYAVIIGLTTAVGSAAVLFIGIQHVQSGVLTLGGLLVIMTYLVQLYEPLKVIGRKVTGLQKSLAGAERVFDLLDEAPDVEERADALPLTRAKGAIGFEQVSFGYESGSPVVDEVSFEVPEGSCFGIVGPTGSGKTTLTGLMLRFFDPGNGRVTLDGRDLRDYKVADLRNQFAVVLQDAVLFSTTIEENIRYAQPHGEFADVERAARAANAHDFISALPEGYATPVGERGMRLSGGERQRIALARAFLKDAPVLILDEPTSSLDIHTETVVMEAMQRLMQGRTTVMIAHRLTTLKNCDALMTLKDGKVIDITTDVTGMIYSSLGMENPAVKENTHAGNVNA